MDKKVTLKTYYTITRNFANEQTKSAKQTARRNHLIEKTTQYKQLIKRRNVTRALTFIVAMVLIIANVLDVKNNVARAFTNDAMINVNASVLYQIKLPIINIIIPISLLQLLSIVGIGLLAYLIRCVHKNQDIIQQEAIRLEGLKRSDLDIEL